MAGRRTTRRWTILLMAVTLACTVRAISSEPEDELKSAAVLMFLRFTEWREPAAAGGPVVIGVAGRSDLMEVLRRVLNGKSIDNRPIRVVDLKTTRDEHCCHLVYVAAGKAADIKYALLSSYSAHALTIGESERFLDDGGAVNLFLADERISFEVNPVALERAGITVSSKLLRVGQIRDPQKRRRR